LKKSANNKLQDYALRGGDMNPQEYMDKFEQELGKIIEKYELKDDDISLIIKLIDGEEIRSISPIGNHITLLPLVKQKAINKYHSKKRIETRRFIVPTIISVMALSVSIATAIFK
jgi:hypothetical protein